MTDVVKLEWQDIANAPRDGSPVLLRHYAHDQRPYVAMWKETVCPGLPWVSTLLDHAWPEDAFTHYVALSDLEALKVERDALREACLDVGAHLVAAVSVIERAEESGNHPSCVYGSDKMYSIALGDFRKSIDRARSLLAEPTPNTEDEDGTPCRAISPARQRGASRA